MQSKYIPIKHVSQWKTEDIPQKSQEIPEDVCYSEKECHVATGKENGGNDGRCNQTSAGMWEQFEKYQCETTEQFNSPDEIYEYYLNYCNQVEIIKNTNTDWRNY